MGVDVVVDSCECCRPVIIIVFIIFVGKSVFEQGLWCLRTGTQSPCFCVFNNSTDSVVWIYCVLNTLSVELVTLQFGQWMVHLISSEQCIYIGLVSRDMFQAFRLLCNINSTVAKRVDGLCSGCLRVRLWNRGISADPCAQAVSLNRHTYVVLNETNHV